MAKSKTKQEGSEQEVNVEGLNPETPEVEIPTEEETTPTETPEETPNETPEVEVAEAPVKKVKIHATEDIDCFIAGTPVSIRKDKEAEVPSDVAAILCFSKKAYRL
jgi:hypothetical protein|nr:MAG TPA: hypothetical protein [Caudoviricetes sp.]